MKSYKRKENPFNCYYDHSCPVWGRMKCQFYEDNCADEFRACDLLSVCAHCVLTQPVEGSRMGISLPRLPGSPTGGMSCAFLNVTELRAGSAFELPHRTAAPVTSGPERSPSRR